MGDADIPPPVAPPKKRSLFRRKISDLPDTPVEDGVEFFSRAKDLFPIRAAEEEEKRQKKLEKFERKRSTASAESKTRDTPEKRRRLSSQAQDEKDYSSGHEEVLKLTSNSTHGGMGPPASGVNKSQGSSVSHSERFTRDLSKMKNVSKPVETGNTRDKMAAKKSPVGPISISDDDDDYILMIKEPVPIIDDEHETQEVEELPHLVAKARERRERLKALERRNADTFSGQNRNIKGTNNDDDDIFDDGKVSADEAQVEIFITSEIPNTTPVVFKRKLFQPLKLVREVWADKFIGLGVIPESMKNSIILTWKHQQLFDVSTCASLCLPGSSSSVSSEALDENGRLHIEVWTHELLQAHLRKLVEPPPEPQQEPIVKYRILLKGEKDKVPIKMRCLPSTLVQRMIDQYCSQVEVPDDKEITLQFEGDKLDPTLMVSETVLGEEEADGDALQVEVHVK